MPTRRDIILEEVTKRVETAAAEEHGGISAKRIRDIVRQVDKEYPLDSVKGDVKGS